MKKIISVLVCVCLLFGILTGCGAQNPLNPKNPVTLVMWHNFGGEMEQTMDALIDEFNATVGKERGIIINVEAITSSSELQNALNMIINGDPGAPEMPDITTAYPKTAIRFQSKGLLANLDDYFTKKELDAYIPAFVEEGRFGDGGLYVFPFAKSTEILFVNKTLFDRFAASAGVTMDCFDTFEGIADAAEKYYEWTDSQTPEIPNDGKQFYTADSWFNLAQAGMLQQGANLFEGESLYIDNDAYRRIWETCYGPSVKSGFAIYDGYSSDLSKTGDIICSTGSSAGILFYGDTVTYPDNTTENVEYSVLPFPVFDGGEKVAIQRGNGLMVGKSDIVKETAAAVFIKWFTAPEQNMKFVAETGYMPVTDETFKTRMPQAVESAQNPYIRQMLEAVTAMQSEYKFFVAPVFNASDGISSDYEKKYKTLLTQKHEEYLAGNFTDSAYALTEFISSVQK